MMRLILISYIIFSYIFVLIGIIYTFYSLAKKVKGGDSDSSETADFLRYGFVPILAFAPISLILFILSLSYQSIKRLIYDIKS